MLIHGILEVPRPALFLTLGLRVQDLEQGGWRRLRSRPPSRKPMTVRELCGSVNAATVTRIPGWSCEHACG
jgi:hypothetical protein